jgi:hypothetical protein
MEHIIAIAVKTKISFEEEVTEEILTSSNPISLLFVLKKMDNEINPIMLEILQELVKSPHISYYFTD